MLNFFGINRLLRFSMNKHIIIKLLNQPRITDTLLMMRDCMALMGAKASAVGIATTITQLAKGMCLADVNTSTPNALVMIPLSS
jgi:uncharacterized protein YneF (UPF0154 family)